VQVCEELFQPRVGHVYSVYVHNASAKALTG
jgi:hypothetical protein